MKHTRIEYGSRLRYPRRILCALLAAIMIAPLNVGAATADDRDKYSDNSTVQKYEREIAEYERQTKAIRDKLSSLDDDIDDAAEKKAYYDEYIEVTETKIAETEALIDELGMDIAALEESIEVNETLSETLYEQVKERIRLSYESGSATYLELIFGASSLSEFMVGIDQAVRLLEYDTALMKQYEQTEASLSEQRGRLTESELAARQMEEQLNADMADAQNMRDECDALIEKLTADKDSQNRLLGEFNSKLDAAAKKLDDYIDELIRQHGTTANVAEGEFMWPLPTKYTTITSSFGPRKDPFGSGTIAGHGGTDIYCPEGTSVYASNNGTVLRAEKDSSYGNYVLIDHGGGIYTLYAHCSKLLVKAGDKVAKGEVIAKSGQTGHVTGPHLHLEVRVNGTRVDAMDYVKKP